MKLLKQISKLVFLFSMLGLLQNCSSPENEVLEPTVVATIDSNSGITGRRVDPGNNQWVIRFNWPSQLTEEQRQWTRDYYLYAQEDYVYSYAVEINLPEETGNTPGMFERWVVSEYLTHFNAVLCDGCVPTQTSDEIRIEVVSIETF